MSRTYAIADLHGRYDLLDRALDEVAARGGGTVVLLGDYVDRGPQSRQVIERLMAGSPAGQRWICLKGNHEDIMVQTCRNPRKLDWWLPNGGGATLLSYGQRLGQIADVRRVPHGHVAWLAALPLMHVDQHRVFVHAGVRPSMPLDRQSEETLLWMLYPDGAEDGHGELHVVHGHHQFEGGPLLFSGRTNLDTVAWLTGRLVVGVFDDDVPGGPVELIEIRGEPVRRVE